MTNSVRSIGLLPISWKNFLSFIFLFVSRQLNEGLVKYSGCCGFLQYNAIKPTKRGIKTKSTNWQKKQSGDLWHCNLLGWVTMLLIDGYKDHFFLSTLSHPSAHIKIMHTVGHRYIQVSTPSSAKNYSNSMNGVAKHVKILSCFKSGALGHKSNKFWKWIFWHLVNMCAANAWILFSETSQGQRLKYYDNMSFHCELAKDLIDGYTNHQWSVLTDHFGQSSTIENWSTHQFVRMQSTKPKSCVHHTEFQPNKKKCFDSLYSRFQCNSYTCCDCFHIL